VEHEQSAGDAVHGTQAGFFHQSSQQSVQPDALAFDHRARRVGDVGELAAGVLERAAPKILARHPVGEPVEQREELGARVERGVEDLALDDLLPGGGTALQAGGDQVVFRGEVGVERRLRDSRFVDDALHPHRLDTLLIEESRGGVDEAVGNWFAGRCAFLCHTP